MGLYSHSHPEAFRDGKLRMFKVWLHLSNSSELSSLPVTWGLWVDLLQERRLNSPECTLPSHQESARQLGDAAKERLWLQWEGFVQPLWSLQVWCFLTQHHGHTKNNSYRLTIFKRTVRKMNGKFWFPICLFFAGSRKRKLQPFLCASETPMLSWNTDELTHEFLH